MIGSREYTVLYRQLWYRSSLNRFYLRWQLNFMHCMESTVLDLPPGASQTLKIVLTSPLPEIIVKIRQKYIADQWPLSSGFSTNRLLGFDDVQGGLKHPFDQMHVMIMQGSGVYVTCRGGGHICIYTTIWYALVWGIYMTCRFFHRHISGLHIQPRDALRSETAWH